MLKITAHHSLSAALWYFRHELKSGYYSEQGTSPGTWHGKLAERLGLAGEIGEKEWANLCHNLLPDGSGPLTPNTKEDRRICVDFTYNAPKSASLEAAFGKNREAVRRAFREAVHETMLDIEQDIEVRVRKDGQQASRPSRNLLYGMFFHDLTRPQDKVPDMHLHAHCVVQNSSWDPIEDRIKAAAFTLIRDGRYYEAMFHSRFTSKLADVGHGINRRGDYWELAGYSRQSVEAFSRRREKILKDAAERGITDPAERTRMVLRTRERKNESLSREEIEAQWRNIAKGLAIPTEIVGPSPTGERVTAEKCVGRALIKHLEKDSVVLERAVLESAMRFGFGQVRHEDIHAALDSREGVLTATFSDGRSYLTTQAVLAEEQEILRHAREGRGQCTRLDHIYKCGDPALSPDQREAVGHILASRDRTILAAQRAGPEGNAVLRASLQAIESAGKRAILLTPTSQERDKLAERGFAEAIELKDLFADKELAAKARGQVIWLDSAHQTGRQGLKRIIEATKDLGARLVLAHETDSRDSSRGSAIGLLRKEAGLDLPPALKGGPERDPAKELPKLLDGLSKTDRLREFAWEKQRDAALCDAHTQAVTAGKSVAVFAATNREAERITIPLREGLRTVGKLQGEEVTFGRLTKLPLAETDRRDPKRYQEGQVVQFLRPGGGFAAGTRAVIASVSEAGEVRVRTEKGERTLPLHTAARFQVYQKDTIQLAAGDRIRLTQGTRMPSGKMVNAGQPFTVSGFTRTGDIETSAGRTLPRAIGHIAHDWVATTPPAVPRADVTLISQPAASVHPASLTRILSSTRPGAEKPVVFTDDAKRLQAATLQLRERVTATELAHTANVSVPQLLLQLRRQQEEHAVTFGRIVGASPHVRRLIADRTMILHQRERSRGRA